LMKASRVIPLRGDRQLCSQVNHSESKRQVGEAGQDDQVTSDAPRDR
jgi:hypothetical protein